MKNSIEHKKCGIVLRSVYVNTGRKMQLIQGKAYCINCKIMVTITITEDDDS